MNPYEILGIPAGSTHEVARAAFRRLAKETHPDRNPDDPGAAERFGRIARAYEMIQGASAHAESARPATSNPSRKDVRKTVKIGLAEAYTGGTIRIAGAAGVCTGCSGEGFLPTRHRVVCSTCLGSGMSDYHERGIIRVRVQCPECAGRGHTMRIRCEECDGLGVSGNVPAEVKVPPGCRDGAVFMVPNGASDLEKNIVGDLEVVISILDHPTFRLSGDDLETEVTVEVWEAALGASVPVPLLVGNGIRLTLPPGTQPGRRFRLKGRGMPTHAGAGDLIVTLKVRIPDASSGMMRDAFSTLRDVVERIVRP